MSSVAFSRLLDCSNHDRDEHKRDRLLNRRFCIRHEHATNRVESPSIYNSCQLPSGRLSLSLQADDKTRFSRASTDSVNPLPATSTTSPRRPRPRRRGSFETRSVFCILSRKRFP